MFIRGKPIRFGYKLCCLCSSKGYLYNCINYAGSADNYNKEVGLGADVVLRLLDNIEFADRHTVYFDNFFTSYYLMCLLKEDCVQQVLCGQIESGELCLKPEKV
ncbi:PiggyBac transposable element-derived protein 3 [Lucilia cuprina]|nr:PiggyBac transposable element-derived protein 3 [Lucilia cuprina]